MKQNPISPTIANLQTYLVQLQEVLRNRQEAAAALELTKLELNSIEAQAQRAAEIERAQLKMQSEHAFEDKRRQIQLESDRRRQNAEIEKARITAEAIKQSRIEAINLQTRRQEELEKLTNQMEFDSAKQQLQSFLVTYDTQLKKFLGLKKEILSYLSENASRSDVIDGLKVVSSNIRILPRFIELLSVLEESGVEKSEAVKLVQPVSFVSLLTDLSDLTEKIERVPATGMTDWEPISIDGNSIPPWAPYIGVVAWRQKKSNYLWTGIIDKIPFKSTVDRKGADSFIEIQNLNHVGGSDKWRLPSIDELREIMQDPYHKLIAFDKFDRVWANYANATGRATIFNLTDGSRETTSYVDLSSLILVSSKN